MQANKDKLFHYKQQKLVNNCAILKRINIERIGKYANIFIYFQLFLFMQIMLNAKNHSNYHYFQIQQPETNYSNDIKYEYA